MKMPSISKKYAHPKDNQSQYEKTSFKVGEITDAVYVEPKLKTFIGNKYIEALPCPPDKATIARLSVKPVPGYEPGIEDKSKYQQLLEIRMLEDFRIPLPAIEKLWNHVYDDMCMSYYKREEYKLKHRTREIQMRNETVTVADSLLLTDKGSSVLGFNMIGKSGCGKTSSLKTVLDYFPKVIRHYDENGNGTIQIPVLFVTCAPSSNFRVLYANIGKEIDTYLGNTNGYYQNMIKGSSRTTLGEMLQTVEKLINEFAIGLIVFDEIQLVEFNQNIENSFNALMTMSNETLVSLGICGTEEAFVKISKIEQIGRRVGDPLPCDEYIKDKKFYDKVFSKLERYQWADKPVKFPPEIRDVIYRESRGIIAYVVLIYMMIWYTYVLKPPAQIDLKFVIEVIDTYFGTIRTALNGVYLSDKERENKIKREVERAKLNLELELSKRSSQESSKFIQENVDEMMDEAILEDKVITAINSIYPNTYSEQRVREYFKAVRKKNSKGTAAEITGEVLKKLIKGHTDKRPGASKKTKTEDVRTVMRSAIFSSVGDPNDPLK